VARGKAESSKQVPAYDGSMGYGDQIGDLSNIQELAKKLFAWINGDRGVFPPHSIIEAITPQLQAIRRDLENFVWVVEERTAMDRELHTRIEPLVFPYEIKELMALTHGKGAYVLVEAPYRFPWDDDDWHTRVAPKAGGDISVAVYVDAKKGDVADRVIAAVDQLVDAMGYDGPLDEEIERGSIFRRSRAKAKQVLTSPELQTRLIKVERAIELAGLELNQAQVDQREADAVARLLSELRDVPRACVRAGSVVVAKFTTPDGPVILARTLSQIEVRAIEEFPEMQRYPEQFLEALAIAVQNLSANVPELPDGDDLTDA
jgi:hypothetical protein